MTSRRKPPKVPLFDEIPEDPPPVLERDKNYHPMDVREGVIEKLIKYAAEKSGNFVGDDDVYLEQYLHPDKDVIPKQPLRPTRMKNPPDMEFRRVPEQLPLQENGTFRAPNLAGLGSSQFTEGKDFNSVYDIWDFDTKSRLIGDSDSKNPLVNAADWAAKKFMQNIGTPFAVYERYPKNTFTEDDDLLPEPGTGIPLEDYGDMLNNKKKGKK